MSEVDFDWSSTDVVVETVDAVAVYTNPAGHIVIRQQGTSPADDDSFVIVPRRFVADVIAALQRELGN